MSETAIPQLPQLPDLNREKVVDRINGSAFFDWEDFGSYTLALKAFKFGVGQKKNPHFVADCVVLDSTNAKWAKGQEVSVYFHTGRPGTANDAARPDRDDAYLAGFLRAVYKVKRGDQYDNNKALAQMLKADPDVLQLLESGALHFRFVRKRNPKTIEVKNPVTKEVIQTVEKVFCKDSFEIVA